MYTNDIVYFIFILNETIHVSVYSLDGIFCDDTTYQLLLRQEQKLHSEKVKQNMKRKKKKNEAIWRNYLSF